MFYLSADKKRFDNLVNEIKGNSFLALRVNVYRKLNTSKIKPECYIYDKRNKRLICVDTSKKFDLRDFNLILDDICRPIYKYKTTSYIDIDCYSLDKDRAFKWCRKINGYTKERIV